LHLLQLRATEVSSTSSPTTTRTPPISAVDRHGGVQLAAELLFQCRDQVLDLGIAQLEGADDVASAEPSAAFLSMELVGDFRQQARRPLSTSV
jgi:hypothetical protein